MGLRLLQGALFATTDNPAARETVISSAPARRLFGDAPAVGRQFTVRRRGVASAPHTVKGVVSDNRHQDLRSEVPNIYFSQASAPTRYMRLLVRVRPGDSPAQQASTIRVAVREFDPQLPLTELRPLREVVDEFLIGEVNIARMLTEHAFTALVLALVGIYGVMAFSIAARTREIAVRMALGATRRTSSGTSSDRLRRSGIGVAMGLAIAHARAVPVLTALRRVGRRHADVRGRGCAAVCRVAAGVLLPVRARAIDPARTLRAE
jgi:putative ABC transport system permease protein